MRRHMRTYAAITLVSQTMPLPAISALVGTDPDVELAADSGLTRWELRATAPEEAPLAEHVSSVIDRVRPFAERLRAGRSALDSCCLDIGIYLDLGDPVPTIAISQEQMNFLAKLGVALELHLFLPGEAEVSFDERPLST